MKKTAIILVCLLLLAVSGPLLAGGHNHDHGRSGHDNEHRWHGSSTHPALHGYHGWGDAPCRAPEDRPAADPADEPTEDPDDKPTEDPGDKPGTLPVEGSLALSLFTTGMVPR